MIVFWLICAGLVAVALAWVLPALLQGVSQSDNAPGKKEANIDVYRDQLSELDADLANGIISPEQHQQDRDEIERRLLEDVAATDVSPRKHSKPVVADRRTAYVLAASIPLIAIALYLIVGTPAAVSGTAPSAQPAPFAGSPNNGEMTQKGIEANVAKLAKRLEQNPSDADGWRMLGRSYMSLQKFSEASDAYAKAVALKTDDPDLLTDYAFALAMLNGRQLQGKPLEAVNKALKLDPKNPKALQLAGTAAFQMKNYAQAIADWQKVLAMTPPDSELARSLTEQIKEAKSLLGP